MDHALGSPSKYMTTIYNYFCIKIIFLDFLKVKNLGKYAPKRTKLYHSKKKLGGSICPQTPLANAWLRHASQPPPRKKIIVGPPLANPAYAHELLMKNLFENPPGRQLIVCSTLYVYAL